jgi:hypothetical protein
MRHVVPAVSSLQTQVVCFVSFPLMGRGFVQVCNATAAAATGNTVPNLGSPSSNQVCRESLHQPTAAHPALCPQIEAPVSPAMTRHPAQQ